MFLSSPPYSQAMSKSSGTRDIEDESPPQASENLRNSETPEAPGNPESGRVPLPVGKLDPDVLEKLVASRGSEREKGGADAIIVGPGIGLDGAVMDLRGPGGLEEGEGDEAPSFLVAASDPITFAAEEIGWYAVHVNANDVACMGALPRWFVATILLPEGAGEEDAAKIFQEIHRGCRQVGATLVGGHTEVTPGMDRPILVGTMLGVTNRWISAAGAKPGDTLLLTKGAGIEGTAILAREARDRLAGKVEDHVVDRARDFLHDPGISVVPEAGIIREVGTVHALHDPTEGGVAGGIHELCQASGTGARIHLDAIPVFQETRKLAAVFDIDPLGLIGSGALLIAAAPEDARAMVEALRAESIAAVPIGTVEEEKAGVVAVERGNEKPLRRFINDELTRIL